MSQSKLKHLTPKQAHKLILKDVRAVLIDIRSTMEYLFVGHPVGAVHLAWIDEPDWMINPNFVTEVRKLILGGNAGLDSSDSVSIILICRSGKRTLEAGKMLVDAGFDNVFNVLEGFEGDLDEHHQRGNSGGWRFHGLPWEQC